MFSIDKENKIKSSVYEIKSLEKRKKIKELTQHLRYFSKGHLYHPTTTPQKSMYVQMQHVRAKKEKHAIKGANKGCYLSGQK